MGNDSKIWKWTVIALFLFVYELVGVLLYSYGYIHFFVFLVLHGLAIVAVGRFVYQTFQAKEDLCYPLLLFISNIVASAFGVAGFLLLVILRPILSKLSSPASKWFAELFPEDTTSSFKEIFLRIQLGWDDYSHITEVSSFLDLMYYGSISEKQAVLDAVIKNFSAEYGPILRLALIDPCNIIRIQAASVASRIDMDFEDRLMELLLERRKDERDKDIALKLARHYEVYASLGIVDQARRSAIIEKALYFYRAYLELDPTNHSAQLSIGSLLFHGENYAEFTTWYHQFKKQYHTVPEIVHAWYLEALYRERQYEELALEVKRI